MAEVFVIQTETFVNQAEGNLQVGALAGAHEHIPVTKTHHAIVKGAANAADAKLLLVTGKP